MSISTSEGWNVWTQKKGGNLLAFDHYSRGRDCGYKTAQLGAHYVVRSESNNDLVNETDVRRRVLTFFRYECGQCNGGGGQKKNIARVGGLCCGRPMWTCK